MRTETGIFPGNGVPLWKWFFSSPFCIPSFLFCSSAIYLGRDETSCYVPYLCYSTFVSLNLKRYTCTLRRPSQFFIAIARARFRLWKQWRRKCNARYFLAVNTVRISFSSQYTFGERKVFLFQGLSRCATDQQKNVCRRSWWSCESYVKILVGKQEGFGCTRMCTV